MKLLIVDDHPLVRKGLLAVLACAEGIESIAEASSWEEALSSFKYCVPDIAIVDLHLGNADGLELIQRLRKENSSSKFVILTSSVKREDFARAKQMGVDGYILKHAYAEDILYALRVVSRGVKFFDPELMQQDVCAARDGKVDELTEREKEVLYALSKGLSNIQIAEKLFISEHTVKKHISSILAKLNLSHRTEAALYANNLLEIRQGA